MTSCSLYVLDWWLLGSKPAFLLSTKSKRENVSMFRINIAESHNSVHSYHSGQSTNIDLLITSMEKLSEHHGKKTKT